MKKCQFCGQEFKRINRHEKWCPENPNVVLSDLADKRRKQQEAKQRYFYKKHAEASTIKCACGCGETLKAVDEYGRNRQYVSGHNRRKYDDPLQHKREWNHRNREKKSQYKTAYGRRRKAKLLTMMGGTCCDCGRQYDGKNAGGFDFHHVGVKSFALSIANLVNHKWSDIVEESKKCVVICAFCHRVKHFGGF